MQNTVLRLFLKGLASLPLGLTQLLGGLGGILAYLGSSHFRGLFQNNYGHAMSLNGIKPSLLQAAASSGMLFMDSLWIWRNPQKALMLAEIQNWTIVEEAIGKGRGLVMPERS